MSEQHRAPRWWRWLRAFIGGYFWWPCPRCGEPFAGYEVTGATIERGGKSWAVCPPCARDIRE